MGKFVGRVPEAKHQLLASTWIQTDLWKLYRWFPTEKTNLAWVNLKLICATPRKTKANFWLAFNRPKKKWSLGSDLLVLEKKYPKLCGWVEGQVGKFLKHPAKIPKRKKHPYTLVSTRYGDLSRVEEGYE